MDLGGGGGGALGAEVTPSLQKGQKLCSRSIILIFGIV